MTKNNKLSIAYAELYEILKFLPQSDKKKIPNEYIESIKEKKSNEYNISIDMSQKIDNQISDYAKVLFIDLYKKYLATEYENKIIAAKEFYNRKSLEEIKRKKFPINNIFNNN